MGAWEKIMKTKLQKGKISNTHRAALLTWNEKTRDSDLVSPKSYDSIIYCNWNKKF